MEHGMRATRPLIHDSFRYGDEESRFFEREGYHIFDHFLTDETLIEARSHADRMISQLAEGITGTEMSAPHQLGEK
jgi:hypothetical protein